jgi:hypothetical protein
MGYDAAIFLYRLTLAVIGHLADRPRRSPARNVKVAPGSTPDGTGNAKKRGSPLDSVETA